MQPSAALAVAKSIKGQTFTTMDGLRGVAAVMVVAYHAPGSHPLLPGGYLAVDLFFALSGFVLAHSGMHRLTTFGASLPFIVKRLIRLYPLYLVGLALGVVAYVYSATTDGNLWPTALLVNVGLNGLFWPVPMAYSLNAWSAYALNCPAWSLSFELLVNIILAVTAFLYTARRLGVVILIAAIGLIITGLSHGSLDSGSVLATFPLSFARVMFSFFVGVAIYRAWAAGRIKFSMPWWASIAALIALLCVPIPPPFRAVADLLIAMLAFPFLLATATGTPKLRLLGFLGRVSYAIYIIHGPIMGILRTGSKQLLGRDFESFGLLGTAVLLLLVLGLATLLDPADAAIRQRLSSLAARSRWLAGNPTLAGSSTKLASRPSPPSAL